MSVVVHATDMSSVSSSQPYVHMKYIPVTGQKKYCDMMRDLSGANDKDKKVRSELVSTGQLHAHGRM